MWGLFRILDDFNLLVRVSAFVLANINSHSILIIWLIITVNTQEAHRFRSNLTPSSEGKRQNIFIIKSSRAADPPVAPTTNVKRSMSLGLKCLYYAQASEGQWSHDSMSDPETWTQTWHTYTERARAHVTRVSTFSVGCRSLTLVQMTCLNHAALT